MLDLAQYLQYLAKQKGLLVILERFICIKWDLEMELKLQLHIGSV